MSLTLKAPEQARFELGHFWARYFSEIPTCTCGACDAIAIEVDPYFPYLDDFNRCIQHQLEPMEAESGAVS